MKRRRPAGGVEKAGKHLKKMNLGNANSKQKAERSNGRSKPTVGKSQREYMNTLLKSECIKKGEG